MFRAIQLQTLILLGLIVLFSASAYAASADISNAKGGEGAGTISGWTISNVHYHPADDPTWLSSVEFDLDAPARTVKINLNTSAPKFINCENSHGTHWVCRVEAGIRIASIDELRVVAAGTK
ncbi:MAG: hypothetical protein HXY42_13640 [Chloroflexi bacterium]|nr:hypothetical protein [Chloroflexota bacterium]